MSQKTNSEIKVYKTSDIYFASFLTSVGFPLQDTEKTHSPSGHKKVVFIFTISELELNKFKAMYFGGMGNVKARVFVDNLRSLKSICFT